MFIAESPLIGCWVQAYSKNNFPTSTIDCCTALQEFNRSSTSTVLSFKETANFRNQFRRISIWIRQLKNVYSDVLNRSEFLKKPALERNCPVIGGRSTAVDLADVVKDLRKKKKSTKKWDKKFEKCFSATRGPLHPASQKGTSPHRAPPFTQSPDLSRIGS